MGSLGAWQLPSNPRPTQTPLLRKLIKVSCWKGGCCLLWISDRGLRSPLPVPTSSSSAFLRPVLPPALLWQHFLTQRSTRTTPAAVRRLQGRGAAAAGGLGSMGAAIPAPRSPHCAWEPADLGGTFEPHGGMGELCPWPQPSKHFAFVLLMYFQGFSCDGDETQCGLFCVTGGVGMSEQGCGDPTAPQGSPIRPETPAGCSFCPVLPADARATFLS